jgi:hypothetical protein
VGGVSGRKGPIPRRDPAGLKVLGGKIMSPERRSPSHLAKIVFGSGFFADRWAESEIFENQSAAIIQGDFFGTSTRALVKAVWIRIGWIPETVEPTVYGGDARRRGLRAVHWHRRS